MWVAVKEAIKCARDGRPVEVEYCKEVARARSGVAEEREEGYFGRVRWGEGVEKRRGREVVVDEEVVEEEGEGRRWSASRVVKGK